MGEKSARLIEGALEVAFEGGPRKIGAELAAPAGPVNVKGVWLDVAVPGARAASSL